jgi:hypothetical protein
MKTKVRPTGTVHSYERRSWGHDFSIRSIRKGGKFIEGSLWLSERLQVGDWLILPSQGRTTRYIVTESRPCMDPDDMYHFTAKFDPRES